MSPTHRACFNIGSNLQPEINIPAALELLQGYGRIGAISRVCETGAVGTTGPNFLNLGVLLLTTCEATRIKADIVRPIEARLGRVRTPDKNSPRTIDIDLILFDGIVLQADLWDLPFLAISTAAIEPDLQHPQTGESLGEAANRHLLANWVRWRDDIPLPSPER